MRRRRPVMREVFYLEPSGAAFLDVRRAGDKTSRNRKEGGFILTSSGNDAKSSCDQLCESTMTRITRKMSHTMRLS